MSEAPILEYLKTHPSKLVKTPGLFMARWSSFKDQKGQYRTHRWLKWYFEKKTCRKKAKSG